MDASTWLRPYQCGCLLVGFLHIQSGYFAHPARVTLLAVDDKSKRSSRRRNGLPVATVSKNYNAIGKVGIELWQREHDVVAVGRFGDHVEPHIRALELLAERDARTLQKVRNWHAVISDA